jgi:uncharacterized protein (TIGR02996 family)
MARNLELEEAILRENFSPEAFLVYGDWLTAQGDWRGELVEVQARLASSARGSRVLVQREKELLARHNAEWIPYDWRIKYGWSHGFIEGISVEDLAAPRGVGHALEKILARPEARFVRNLYVAGPNGEFATAPPVLAAARPPIRSIRAELQGLNNHAGELGDLSPLWTLKTLAHVRFVGASRGLVLGEIDAPALGSFTLQTPDGYTPDMTASIGAARWPLLNHLVLHRVTPADLFRMRPILAGTGAPALRHLDLEEANLDENILDEVARWPVLAQLESLIIEVRRLTEAGARAIVASADAFRKLALFRPHRAGGVELEASRILRAEGLVR